MLRAEAIEAMEPLVEAMRPYCARLAVAGSIRRRKRVVSDGELVCIPQVVQQSGDLFGVSREVPYLERRRAAGFIQAVGAYPKIRGEASTGRYTRRRMPNGLEVDVFICCPETWGTVYAVRTGCADFSSAMARRWVELGWHSEANVLRRGDGERRTFAEERELFAFLGWDWLEPYQRTPARAAALMGVALGQDAMDDESEPVAAATERRWWDE